MKEEKEEKEKEEEASSPNSQRQLPEGIEEEEEQVPLAVCLTKARGWREEEEEEGRLLPPPELLPVVVPLPAGAVAGGQAQMHDAGQDAADAGRRPGPAQQRRGAVSNMHLSGGGGGSVLAE